MNDTAQEPNNISFRIPRIAESEHLNLILKDGDTLFVVGANGTGKSALMQHFAVQSFHNPNRPFKQFTAHRQNWSNSDSPTDSPAQRQQNENHIKNSSADINMRWQDNLAGQRISLTISDLITAENHAARRSIKEGWKKNSISYDEFHRKNPNPVDRLNMILNRGTLSIQINISSKDAIMAVRNHDKKEYGFSKLSDGERNAVLLSTDIITAKTGTVFLIDEPERHLHRAIITPLLTALFAERSDCIFIIATHEIDLAVNAKHSRTLLLRDCSWQNDNPIAWDIDQLEPDTEFPEDIRHSILGSRRNILFTEGDDKSLDLPLYALLFPKLSLQHRSTCRAVIQAVSGLRSETTLAWVNAFGLIDHDGRSQEEIEKFASGGIYALPANSVESLYYGTEAIRFIAEFQAKNQHVAQPDSPADKQQKDIEENKQKMITKAIEAAISSVSNDKAKNNLASLRCERMMRNAALKAMPNRNELEKAKKDIDISIKNPFNNEMNKLNGFIKDKDWCAITERYAIKKSGALTAIAKTMSYPSAKEYEQAVLVQISKNPDFKEEILKKLAGLRNALNDS